VTWRWRCFSSGDTMGRAPPPTSGGPVFSGDPSPCGGTTFVSGTSQAGASSADLPGASGLARASVGNGRAGATSGVVWSGLRL
jgi:hypothetical protein